tara:strand:- start:74 stop:580 length:507 start_codon:yes stop_codon:yes gene_type:complete
MYLGSFSNYTPSFDYTYDSSTSYTYTDSSYTGSFSWEDENSTSNDTNSGSDLNSGIVLGYETEENNSRTSADAISASSAITGQLYDSSDKDYFALEVSSAGLVTVDFDSPTNSDYYSYFEVSLLDSSGNTLSSEKSGQDISFTFLSSCMILMFFSIFGTHRPNLYRLD